jgi:protein-tyrosine-phosphatase
VKSPNKFQIVFICTGNICRSPMAEGILRDSLSPQALTASRVVSAGVGAVAGLPPSDHSVTACAEEGIDISAHRSRPISRQMLRDSDLILTMEDHHAEAVKTLAPDLSDRVELLARYGAADGDEPVTGIPDPIGGELEEYRAARDQIREQILAALPRIEREILAGVKS